SLKVGYWEKNSQLGINFAQASFNDAWQGGGVNNIAIGLLYNAYGAKHKGKGVWSNDLQFQYGVLRNKGRNAVKSVDRLFFETKYARSINPKLSWFGSVNFLTQVAPGYNFDANNGDRLAKISNFLAPGFLSEGIGLEWKPVKYFAVQLGGATIRQTFVVDDTVLPAKFAAGESRYGVAAGKKMLNEAGFQVVAAFDKDIAKNLNLKWRYQAFVAYAPEVKPIDHNINLIATAKVNKYLNVNFTLIGIYDKDQADSFQLSQGLAAGLSFKL
ncbi:MAG: DUF3078 domain-containing protein, partial [Spirosomaceae bacterium]|nr:DUF3078 domain-containing protein [Spirosomataceae bacterium]